MKLLAIDGNSIINRAFYGIKLLSTKEGRYTNAVYGFINILNRLLELEHPDGVAVAFDLKSPTFRHKKYEAYKAGRHAMPEELAEQFPTVKQWLSLAGYHCIECEGFEADDILGTLAAAARQQGDECVIATGDRDSLQLISDKTRVLLAATRMGKTEITDYTPEVLMERHGLTPHEMIDLKALMGDSSDNIPGVAGVGEKTATDLITKYHSIDYIYEHLDELEIKDGVRKKLAQGKESAYLSREIGTIFCDVPIQKNIEHYRTAERDSAQLAKLMTELEFFKLMEKMSITPCSAPNANENNTVKEFTVIQEYPETFSDEIDVFIGEKSAAVSSDKVFVLTDPQKILCNPDIHKRVYDYKNLCKSYPDISGITFDAMLAGYLCNPSSTDYSPQRLFDEYITESYSIKGEHDEICDTAVKLSLVCNALHSNLEKTGQLDLLYNIELPLARVLAEMETTGFPLDVDGIKEQSEQFSLKIDEIRNEIYAAAGEEFNINSPKQLGHILFEKLNLPSGKKTKSGYSTNADILEKLKYDFPIVEHILKYRQLSKLKSTYCDGLAAAVSPDGRIRSTFNQTEARTGRISSLEPNLQNIPVRTEEGRKLRRYFRAQEGFVLCDADYSQIELRVLASIADDSTMINAFNNGDDIHTITASEVFDIPADMVLPILRSRAKAVNFGIVYGIGAFSLAKDIGVSRAEADRYIKNYLSTYSGVEKYMQEVISKAKTDGFVTTAFGRRRYLPELSSSNGMMRAFGERVARNAPIQGTAADIIKIAMIKVNDRLKRELPEARLILQVHDELIVECPQKDAERCCRILEEEMETAANLSVRLSVEAHSGKTWFDAKE